MSRALSDARAIAAALARLSSPDPSRKESEPSTANRSDADADTAQLMPFEPTESIPPSGSGLAFTEQDEPVDSQVANSADSAAAPSIVQPISEGWVSVERSSDESWVSPSEEVRAV